MIVLADIKMPRLNGFALISQVLDQLNPANRPYFVYITALSALDVMGKVNAITTKYTGCKVDVIYKPINIKTLETTLKTIINEIDYPETVIENETLHSSPKCERIQHSTTRASTTV
jgi:YesN/AraC family two-component response regulator